MILFDSLGDMTLEQLKLVIDVAAPIASAVVLGWWVRSQFSETKREMYQHTEVVKNQLTALYKEHEKSDSDRHESNLGNFQRIFVALAELGWRNGVPGKRQ